MTDKQPKVFVVQENPNLNYTPAERCGEVVFLTAIEFSPMKNSPRNAAVLETVEAAMKRKPPPKNGDQGDSKSQPKDDQRDDSGKGDSPPKDDPAKPPSKPPSKPDPADAKAQQPPKAGRQLRRQRIADVGHRRLGGDDQGHRRGDLDRPAIGLDQRAVVLDQPLERLPGQV